MVKADEREMEQMLVTALDFEDGVDEYLRQNGSYEVACQMSGMRENILSWYPFNKTATVLELNAEYGAITGLLCRRCSKVVAFVDSVYQKDFLKKRYKNRNNLNIYVDRFELSNLQERFDYIVLRNCREDLSAIVAKLKTMLKTNGKILLIVDNRLGVKYQSGYANPYTNIHYDGTGLYTKKEIQNMLNDNHLSYRFYYPYPDAVFPNEIFTDDSIQKFYYGKIREHYEDNRVALCNPSRIYGDLAQEHILDRFANSFLIEVGSNADAIYYAKLSGDRYSPFQIGTKIYYVNGDKYVEKYPMTRDSYSHIHQMKENSHNVTSKSYNLKDISNDENKLIYPYIEEDNLDKVLYEAARCLNIQLIRNTMEDIKNMICESGVVCVEDIYTDEFIKVFGTAGREHIEREDCVTHVNIDMILDNLYKRNDGYCIIDCEWIMDCYIPVTFILWRMVNEWYNNHQDMPDYLSREEVMGWFGIGEKEHIYIEWTKHFSEQYVGNHPLRHLYRKDIPFDMTAYANKSCQLISKLYYDLGTGYSEEQSLVSCSELYMGRFVVRFDIEALGCMKKIRFDVAEQPCRCRIISATIDGRNQKLNSNCQRCTEGIDYFYTMDPWYRFAEKKICGKKIEIIGELEYLSIAEITNYYMRSSKGKHRLLKKYE